MDVRAADALFNGSVIALVATAATVVLDLFGFFNVAVAASFVLGSGAAFAFAAANAPEWQWVAAGALVGLVGGAAIDRLALDPLRRRGRTAAMVPASIGATLVVYGLSRAVFFPGVIKVQHAVDLSRVATLGRFTFTELQAFAVIATIVCCLLLDFVVRKTRFGNGVRAACENPLAAQLMGMRIDLVPAAAMALTSALASGAGALYTTHVGIPMSAGIPPFVALSALAVVAIAPVGSIGGACGVAYALSLAGALLNAYFPSLPAYAMPCMLIALIAAGLAWRHMHASASAAVET
jgi:branched-chain amino acid transport system permease protein